MTEKRKSITHLMTAASEYRYGYVYFSDEKGGLEKMKFFPEGKFTVEFKDEISHNRTMDYKRRRLNLYPLKHLFREGQLLQFIKESENYIKIQELTDS